MKELFEV